jgi:hypothetical protein
MTNKTELNSSDTEMQEKAKRARGSTMNEEKPNNKLNEHSLQVNGNGDSSDDRSVLPANHHSNQPIMLWNPINTKIDQDTKLKHFQKMIESKYQLKFGKMILNFNLNLNAINLNIENNIFT